MAITNIGTNTLSSNLKTILPECDKIDALVGYFYFSGFKDLHDELKDKEIRILVGMDIDKKIIEKVSTLKELNLDSYSIDTHITSRSSVTEDYIENFSKIFNDNDYFDNEESQKAFEIFLNKIKDGSLKIKKTATANHSKFYILHNKNGGGIVIEGSSNLTVSGLRGQAEHNRILTEKHYYDDDVARFEECWNDPENIILTDIELADNFIKEVKNKIWLYALPDPILMYYRVLSEYFSITEIENMKTPKNITAGKFSDLKYQKDAINLGIDRINKFGGVIIADVVGLGKSIIASAIAHNLGLKTIIIAPPHLEDQWNDYRSEFNFNGFVYSTGKIEEALERHKNDEKVLIILDEAHKHRNEDTDNYKLLHMLCAGHPVMALSATPFNNDPKDIYALIKLFSTPGQSTIRTVENLSMAFHMLFKRYKKVRKNLRKSNAKEEKKEEVNKESHEIAKYLRLMIEPLIIRRSRRDLEEIEDYKSDLKKQGVAFAKVKEPELLEYPLNGMSDLYMRTLEKISPNDRSIGFRGVRYKILSYLKEGSNFAQKLLEEYDDDSISAEEKVQQIKQAQVNIAKFMRRLLVRRFESSVGAFNISLENMITSSEKILDWYKNRQEIPIYKKGELPNAEYLNDLDEIELEAVLSDLDSKGLIRVPASELQASFEEHLNEDIALLKQIKSEWQENDEDPKFDFLKEKIANSITTDSSRKILIFTEFSDTANYLFKKFNKDNFPRILKYSSEDSNDTNKKIIRSNFDAGLEESKQSNDFDVIIATDAISEGFNLHRAGSVINYDIPYNPTKVIQRVGRINRINKKVFEELYIFNFFPTFIGEEETGMRSISTLKMDFIHDLLGEDTKILTKEEDLKNYFTKQYQEENVKNESLSWDARYRNDWLKIKDDREIIEKISKIPHRSRIARKAKNIFGVVAFAKKGSNYIFAFGENSENVRIVSPEEALPLFNEVADMEKSLETSIKFESIYKIAKEHIFKDNTHAPIDTGRRQDALLRLALVRENYTQAVNLCKDLEILIKDFDALPNGLLKDIIDLPIDRNDYNKIFEELKKMFPSSYIKRLFLTADRAKDDGKLIVLSEELIA